MRVYQRSASVRRAAAWALFLLAEWGRCVALFDRAHTSAARRRWHRRQRRRRRRRGQLAGVDDDSAVVFVACDLEVLDDLNPALLEIARIAGTADNVFIVTVQPWTLAARLVPGARWRGTVTSRGSEQDVAMTAVSLAEKLALGGAIGLALAAAFLPPPAR